MRRWFYESLFEGALQLSGESLGGVARLEHWLVVSVVCRHSIGSLSPRYLWSVSRQPLFCYRMIFNKRWQNIVKSILVDLVCAHGANRAYMATTRGVNELWSLIAASAQASTSSFVIFRLPVHTTSQSGVFPSQSIASVLAPCSTGDNQRGQSRFVFPVDTFLECSSSLSVPSPS